MDIARGVTVKRVARVLAGFAHSANADGSAVSASDAVEAAWPEWHDAAVAVLRTLRTPDEAMAAVGDVAVWEAMVLAALGEAAEPGVSG